MTKAVKKKSVKSAENLQSEDRTIYKVKTNTNSRNTARNGFVYSLRGEHFIFLFQYCIGKHMSSPHSPQDVNAVLETHVENTVLCISIFQYFLDNSV